MRRLLFCAVLVLPFGLYGWATVIAAGLGHDGVIGPFYNALGCDWAIFYTAARAWYEGKLAYIYDQIWFKDTLNVAFAHWLRMPLAFPAFHYPPTFLLLLVPFGALGFAASYALAQTLTFGGLVLALRRFAGQAQQFWLYALSLLLCPASSNNVLAGQDMFLVCALFVLGFTMLEAQPLLAGAIIGLASFKPQFGLMVPFALLGARNWRALAGATASTLLLAAVSVVVFGWGVWESWFAVMLHPRHDVAYTGIDWGRLWDDSVFTIATLLGASSALANVVQGIAIFVAGACVFVAYRRPLADDLRFAVFLAASVVASPHLSQYDMVLLALAATILAWHFVRGDVRPIVLVGSLTAWLLPFACPPKATPAGLLMPIVTFGLIWMLMSRKLRV